MLSERQMHQGSILCIYLSCCTAVGLAHIYQVEEEVQHVEHWCGVTRATLTVTQPCTAQTYFVPKSILQER